ncbi:MAG: TIGR01212 family radical SAM protein [Candidatus Omnitrophica bacterium]|nr:TIGR01212 family radical SAM protein [Candidatus Omnitrophota bacterium]
MVSKYYYSFNQYLKEKFKNRVHRLSLNAGFSCPNIDGTLSRDGCIFCNNKAFSHFVNKNFSLEEQITEAKNYAYRRFKAKKFIAYFQSFSNTYGSIEFLESTYKIIKKFDDIVGLAISTRPDCIDETKLKLIQSFTKDYEVYIEYGLQSANDTTLKLINRNHTFSDFQRTVELTNKYKDIKIGVHIILGLPGENKKDMLNTAKVISQMHLWGIKFHCLHIVKGSTLETMYKDSNIKVLSCEDYVDILIKFLEIIPSNWVVLRLVSDVDKNFLIAPLWINNKQKVLQIIEQEFNKRRSYQGKYFSA